MALEDVDASSDMTDQVTAASSLNQQTSLLADSAKRDAMMKAFDCVNPHIHDEPLRFLFYGIGIDPSTLIGKYIQPFDIVGYYPSRSTTMKKSGSESSRRVESTTSPCTSLKVPTYRYYDNFNGSQINPPRLSFHVSADPRLRFDERDAIMKICPENDIYVLRHPRSVEVCPGWDLEQYLWQARGNCHRTTGLRIVDASIGLAKRQTGSNPYGERICRVIGLWLEEMNEMSWTYIYDQADGHWLDAVVIMRDRTDGVGTTTNEHMQ